MSIYAFLIQVFVSVSPVYILLSFMFIMFAWLRVLVDKMTPRRS